MARRKLSLEQAEAVRQKLARSALGKPAHLSERDVEVIQSPDCFRILVYDARLPNGRWDMMVDTGQEAWGVLQAMMPHAYDRALVYAVKGLRQALVPKSRYEFLFLQPKPTLTNP